MSECVWLTPLLTPIDHAPAYALTSTHCDSYRRAGFEPKSNIGRHIKRRNRHMHVHLHNLASSTHMSLSPRCNLGALGLCWVFFFDAPPCLCVRLHHFRGMHPSRASFICLFCCLIGMFLHRLGQGHQVLVIDRLIASWADAAQVMDDMIPWCSLMPFCMAHEDHVSACPACRFDVPAIARCKVHNALNAV